MKSVLLSSADSSYIANYHGRHLPKDLKEVKSGQLFTLIQDATRVGCAIVANPERHLYYSNQSNQCVVYNSLECAPNLLLLSKIYGTYLLGWLT